MIMIMMVMRTQRLDELVRVWIFGCMGRVANLVPVARLSLS